MRTCKMINKLIFYKHLSSCWGQKLLQTNKKLLQNLCCKCGAALFYMGHNNDKISLQFRNLVILIKHEEMKKKMLSCCCPCFNSALLESAFSLIWQCSRMYLQIWTHVVIGSTWLPIRNEMDIFDTICLNAYNRQILLWKQNWIKRLMISMNSLSNYDFLDLRYKIMGFNSLKENEIFFNVVQKVQFIRCANSALTRFTPFYIIKL